MILLQRSPATWLFVDHRENSPVTQTTPEPTLLSWGGVPREKNFPHPWPHCKPVLIALIGPLRPYCSQALLSCSGVSWKKNCSKLALTWKLTLKLTFLAHCISNWKLNGISGINISKVTLNAVNEHARGSRGQWCMTDPLAGPGGGGKLCSGAWKHGPESPVGVISLCHVTFQFLFQC